MAFHEYHMPDLARVAPYIAPRMLMLGAQQSLLVNYPTSRELFHSTVGDQYDELDLDGGNLKLDLNRDLREVALPRYATVFNFGTIEHVWHAHNAWANAMRAIKVGGHLITQSPAVGWEGHGIHLTTPEAIQAFVSKNGFRVLDTWRAAHKPNRGVFWLVAQKERHIGFLQDFEPAWQVYENNQKKPIC